MRMPVLAAAFAFAFAAALPAGEKWIDLFEVNSVEGWTPRGEVVVFENKGGVVSLMSKKNVWVVSDKAMNDFVFEAEIRLPDDAAKTNFNSGLGFRFQGEKGKPKGYQCEVDLKRPGGVYGIGLGGWLYPGKDPAESAEYVKRMGGVFKPGEFNHYKVEARGAKIRTWVNGTLIAEVEHKGQLEGRFGIQHHGSGGTVEFRKVRVRALSSGE